MRILVTGAAGLIGRNVVQILRGYGHVVFATDLYARRGEPLNAQADLTCRESCEHVFDLAKPEAVVHLAGVRGSATTLAVRPWDVFRTNIDLNQNVFTCMMTRKVLRGVYASTALYPEGQCAPIAWSKLHGEIAISALHQQHPGCEFVIAKMANVYGPGDDFGPDSLVIPSLIRRALETDPNTPLEVSGTGGEVRDFLYSEDAARGIAALLPTTHTGLKAHTICSGIPVTIGTVARLVLTACKQADRDIKFTGKMGGQSAVILTPAGPDGWSPKVSLEEGIKKTVAWLRYERDRP